MNITRGDQFHKAIARIGLKNAIVIDGRKVASIEHNKVTNVVHGRRFGIGIHRSEQSRSGCRGCFRRRASRVHVQIADQSIVQKYLFKQTYKYHRLKMTKTKKRGLLTGKRRNILPALSS